MKKFITIAAAAAVLALPVAANAMTYGTQPGYDNASSAALATARSATWARRATATTSARATSPDRLGEARRGRSGHRRGQQRALRKPQPKRSSSQPSARSLASAPRARRHERGRRCRCEPKCREAKPGPASVLAGEGLCRRHCGGARGWRSGSRPCEKAPTTRQPSRGRSAPSVPSPLTPVPVLAIATTRRNGDPEGAFGRPSRWSWGSSSR